MAGAGVEVINSKGCSRLLARFSIFIPLVNSLKSTELMSLASSALSPASSALPQSGAAMAAQPFTGLVICVTGLSKEARKQVMAATERLGGQYSASLHPQCTHLVVQCFSGSKFEHALKHGSRNGLLVVTLGWFVDSVRRNMRLSESLYSVRNVRQSGLEPGELNQLVGLPGTEKSCLPAKTFEDEKPSKTYWQPYLQSSRKEFKSNDPILSNNFIYIDSNISSELKNKVVEAATSEGATFLDHWFIGCHASYVICEGPSIQRYIGHSSCLVTPLWILKSVKEKCLQRLVHFSSDLARQVTMILENSQDMYEDNASPIVLNSRKSSTHRENKENLEERRKIIELAKHGVRSRRCHRMQSCQTPIYQITPSSILDSICWSISEPTSSACIYTESSGTENDAIEHHTPVFFDARGDGRDSEQSFHNFSRHLRECEKSEVVFKNHFLTILFPTDRFGELGPSSRTFFSDGGFTCLQVLDSIYNFYKENMSPDEVRVAIHSDSRHADRLRSLYASKESIEQGFVPLKRIDFLGSRRSFEALKRINGENNGNVYQLLIRA